MRSENRNNLPEWVKLLFLAGVVLLSTLLSRCGVFAGINVQSAEMEGQEVSKGAREGATLERLFNIALMPVGKTMYIWGGGWDSDNEKAGKGATRIGLSPKWEQFARQQDADYDFEEYRYQSEKGLDCSGYVGWVIYNLFEEKNGEEGYVTFSTDMAEDFASRRWGVLIKNPHEFKPGDIVSMNGHVWISLGTCEDDSVLLVHSSPPGVSVCGTAVPGGSERTSATTEIGVTIETSTATEAGTAAETSTAAHLATEFMQEYYPQWQEKYPSRMVSATYLEDVTVFRWNTNTLLDTVEYQNLTGEEMIKHLSESNLSVEK